MSSDTRDRVGPGALLGVHNDTDIPCQRTLELNILESRRYKQRTVYTLIFGTVGYDSAVAGRDHGPRPYPCPCPCSGPGPGPGPCPGPGPGPGPGPSLEEPAMGFVLCHRRLGDVHYLQHPRVPMPQRKRSQCQPYSEKFRPQLLPADA
jgi:hypothetical protein